MMAAANRADATAIVTAARWWLGTPYLHQGSLRGEGADCLGLVRGVWRDVIGAEPERVIGYTSDWLDTGGGDILLSRLQAHFTKVAPDLAAAGDVVVFRMRSHGAAKHLGILSADAGVQGRFIHSYSRRGVVETAMTAGWRRRAVAFFRFPDRSNS